MADEDQPKQYVADIGTLKNSLRIDGDQDDALLQGYLTSAKSFIINAIGPEINGFYELTDVAALVATGTLALASSYYENRATLTTVQNYEVDVVMNSIIGQLRGRYAEVTGGAGDGSQSEPQSNAPTN